MKSSGQEEVLRSRVGRRTALPGQNGALGNRRFKGAVSVGAGRMYPVLSWEPQLPRVICPLYSLQRFCAGLSESPSSLAVGPSL